MKWPTRGSLAGDTAYLAKAKQWFVSELKSLDVTPENVHLIYASDIGDQRIVVAAYLQAKARTPTYSTLSAPAGSTKVPDRSGGIDSRPNGGNYLNTVDRTGSVEGAFARGYGRDGMVMLADDDSLLAITAPGVDRLEVSPQPEYTAEGQASRSWGPLKDLDPDEGVFRFSLTGKEVWPAVRAVADEWVVSDYRLPSGATPLPTPELTRLRHLVDVGREGKPVGRLAEALRNIEANFLGPSIERVEMVRTMGSTIDDFWVTAVIRATRGVSFEVYFHDDPAGRAALGGQFLGPLVRLVPADAAGRGVQVWIEQDKCVIRGWDPSGEAASIGLTVNGKKYPQIPITGSPITATFCGPKGVVPWNATATVELFDKARKKLWSGTPMNYGDGLHNPLYERLDSPSTLGRPAR